MKPDTLIFVTALVWLLVGYALGFLRGRESIRPLKQRIDTALDALERHYPDVAPPQPRVVYVGGPWDGDLGQPVHLRGPLHVPTHGGRYRLEPQAHAYLWEPD